ncbi:hypothetical protein QTP70_006404 [Hemibagrus guttatus]|uniref:Uncharacterized protein n=1 Tax=Hemibagrus guttatus TaxID=175788 RepID=A0AAE0UQL5_9TELE|nr:hypothetical protein QTP70_006404 [Hemibagrus guttatus]
MGNDRPTGQQYMKKEKNPLNLLSPSVLPFDLNCRADTQLKSGLGYNQSALAKTLHGPYLRRIIPLHVSYVNGVQFLKEYALLRAPLTYRAPVEIELLLVEEVEEGRERRGKVVLPEDWETTAEVIRETGRKVLGVSSGRMKEDKGNLVVE